MARKSKAETARPVPFTNGNVWHVRETEQGLEYLSDQWNGRVFGFEERNRVTLTQSDRVVVGIVAFGGGPTPTERHVDEIYPFHIRDEHMNQTEEAFCEAETAASVMLSRFDEQRLALPTVVAISQCQPSIYESEALRGSEQRERLAARVKQAVESARAWGKTVFIDRIHLSLLEGERDITQSAADLHYAAVARDMVNELCDITGQASPPLVLVHQDGGSSVEGRSGAILAEARLDLEHPTLNFVVVGPLYPYPLQQGTRAQIKPAQALMASELANHAVEARHTGKRWYCPLMEEARLVGKTIIIRFLSMRPLVLEDGPHGFDVTHITNGAEIVSVEQSGGKKITLTFDRAPEGDMWVRYAYGGKQGQTGTSKNVGSLRDDWSAKSSTGQTLHRWALSTKVPVTGART